MNVNANMDMDMYANMNIKNKINGNVDVDINALAKANPALAQTFKLIKKLCVIGGLVGGLIIGIFVIVLAAVGMAVNVALKIVTSNCHHTSSFGNIKASETDCLNIFIWGIILVIIYLLLLIPTLILWLKDFCKNK